MSAPTETAATPAAAATDAAPKSSAPFSSTTQDEAEILRQADLLKQENTNMSQELEALRAFKAEQDRIKAEQDRKYAAEREPQYKKYVEHLEAKQGAALDEKEKGVLRAAFCKPEYKKDGDRMWQEFQDNVAVTASKKALEVELAAMKAERDKLMEMQTKLTQSLGPSARRDSYASAVAVPDIASAVNASAAGGVSRDMSSSGLALNEVMGAAPSATEIQCGFLQEYNFPTDVGVRASAGGKQLRMSMPAPPEHALLFDQRTGERNFPASMRWHSPAIYARYANDRSYLDGDGIHSQVVVRNAAGNYEQPVNDVADIK